MMIPVIIVCNWWCKSYLNWCNDYQVIIITGEVRVILIYVTMITATIVTGDVRVTDDNIDYSYYSNWCNDNCSYYYKYNWCMFTIIIVTNDTERTVIIITMITTDAGIVLVITYTHSRTPIIQKDRYIKI